MPGLAHAESRLGHRDEGGRVGKVGEGGLDALGGEGAEGGAEARGLLAGEVEVAVGGRQMGEGADYLEAAKAADLFGEGIRAAPVDADAPHARIYLEMGPDALAGGEGRGRRRARLFDGGDRRVDSAAGEEGEGIVGRRAEDEDWGGYSGFAELERLLYYRDAEVFGALGEELPRDAQHAVPVGVRLDHGHDKGAGARELPGRARSSA